MLFFGIVQNSTDSHQNEIEEVSQCLHLLVLENWKWNRRVKTRMACNDIQKGAEERKTEWDMYNKKEAKYEK